MAHSDVNYLNVGAGSCTVVESPSGHVSMIDINDGTELREAVSMSALERALMSDRLAKLTARLVDPITWVKERVGTNDLFRFILSHPDCDHLAGLRRLLIGRELGIVNFWDIPHSKELSKSDFTSEELWLDWASYSAMRNGVEIEGIEWPKVLNPLRGARQHYWIDDQIEILSPTKQLVGDGDAQSPPSYNDASYVVRVNHGVSSVLIPGDIESKGWNDMLDAGLNLKADVLVASHHGRKSGFSEGAMDAIRPTIVIISTSKLDPNVDAEDEYQKWTDYVYSTREYGTMWTRLHDDGSFELFSESGKIVGFVRQSAA